MTYRILLLSLIAFAITSCNNANPIVEPPADEKQDINIVIQSSKPQGASLVSESERTVVEATVVLFDKDGIYIEAKNITPTGESTICAFTGIQDMRFPLSIFVVANVVGTWEFASTPKWSSMTVSDLDQLVVQNKFSNKTLVKGTTPLPMSARASSPKGGDVAVTLNRLVSQVLLVNESGVEVDYVEFTNLNSGVKLTSVVLPVAANRGFVFRETGLTFASTTTRNYYFMPTIGDEVTVTVKSGAAVKSTKLNRLGGNVKHLATITSNNIDLNITISAPIEWGEDNGVVVK